MSDLPTDNATDATRPPGEPNSPEPYPNPADVVPGPQKAKTCVVCSSPLPEQTGRGRPRKVCRDEDSPTPGGCAAYRHADLERNRRWARLFTGNRQHLAEVFPDGGFTVLRDPE